MKYVFPALMMVLSACASAVYLYDGDWRRALYWAAATVIAVAVTI